MSILLLLPEGKRAEALYFLIGQYPANGQLPHPF
jgi:hypothetical protein